MPGPDDRGAIGFAEKVLELLDEGRYTATYKYAVLLALIDLCLECTKEPGGAPDGVTTRQLAQKTVELYWPHSVPFATGASTVILKQNTSGQAEIISAIVRFRARNTPDTSTPYWQSRQTAPEAFEKLVDYIEWKLIEMPLPRLQVMGDTPREFIYAIAWDKKVTRGTVSRYQDGETGAFDNHVRFLPGVGEYLLQLSGLLRPLIQRRWAALVADWNGLEESRLEAFLFGTVRVSTTKVRAGLWEIQERRCFYCDDRLSDPTRGQVDHFLPWARYPDDGLDNFVVADTKCNSAKSASLAASDHLARWVRRLSVSDNVHGQLAELARRTLWERDPRRSHSAARGIYLRLPDDARLWVKEKEFVAPDWPTIIAALTDDPARPLPSLPEEVRRHPAENRVKEE
jgi:hypothetical protein